MRLAVTGLILIALSACSSRDDTDRNSAAAPPPPKPIHVPAPSADLAPGELPAPELQGVHTARGDWTIERAPEGDTARFGLPGGDAAFTISCDRAGKRVVFLARGVPYQETGSQMRIVTGTGAASFAGRDAKTMTGVTASDLLTDTFLHEVLAKAIGRIGLTIGNGATFAMPASPVIGKVITGCGGRG